MSSEQYAVRPQSESAGREQDRPVRSAAQRAIDERAAAWLAAHPDRDERIQARREADAADLAMSARLDAMLEGRADEEYVVSAAAERSPIPGHAFAGLVSGRDRDGWER
ncbi:hypothetical protein [Nocardia flavorosea]|uniref:Uncharacterized protein n=1 Tax=Nocardia flavorosea TaxID=53429 RepID=A0A846YBH8_9NOCA|nr:hypothetical protein [Nocardia flavorosea]NKY56976.1 hypothetical protein [Nocardia flavorosea]NKY56982.1 hypothetical protein [Nocardia flavorosea]